MNTTLKSISQISRIAFAIKTVPSLALHEYAPHVQDDINRQTAQARARNPGLTHEQFASLNPDYGRIICHSVEFIAEYADGDQVMHLKSCLNGEEDLLQEFNRDLAKFHLAERRLRTDEHQRERAEALRPCDAQPDLHDRD